MKNNKKIVIITIIIAVILLGIGIYFGIRTININKYTKADEYEVKDVKIVSVKKVVGEKKITSYSYKKNNADMLTLKFKDSDKEQSAKAYLDYIKENGNYIEMETGDSNKRQIACSDNGVTSIQTEITDDGFIVTIESGEGTIQINPIEE